MYCYFSPKIALGIPFKRPAELQKDINESFRIYSFSYKIFLLLLPEEGIQTVLQMKALRQYYVSKE